MVSSFVSSSVIILFSIKIDYTTFSDILFSSTIIPVMLLPIITPFFEYPYCFCSYYFHSFSPTFLFKFFKIIHASIIPKKSPKRQFFEAKTFWLPRPRTRFLGMHGIDFISCLNLLTYFIQESQFF